MRKIRDARLKRANLMFFRPETGHFSQMWRERIHKPGKKRFVFDFEALYCAPRPRGRGTRSE